MLEAKRTIRYTEHLTAAVDQHWHAAHRAAALVHHSAHHGSLDGTLHFEAPHASRHAAAEPVLDLTQRDLVAAEAEAEGRSPREIIDDLGSPEEVAAAFNADREFRYAGFWQRLFAFIGDIGVLTLMAVPILTLALLFGLFGERSGEYVNERDRSVLVWVHPGTFTMGFDKREGKPDYGASPAHRVRLTRGYFIGKYEVTVAEWPSGK